jgi:hypothetical protein
MMAMAGGSSCQPAPALLAILRLTDEPKRNITPRVVPRGGKRRQSCWLLGRQKIRQNVDGWKFVYTGERHRCIENIFFPLLFWLFHLLFTMLYGF